MKSYWEARDDEAQECEDIQAYRDAALEIKCIELERRLRGDFMWACMAPDKNFLDKIEANRKIVYPLEHFLEDCGMVILKDSILKLFQASSCTFAQQFREDCAKVYIQDNVLDVAKFQLENTP